ncbi:amidohydrolase [Myxococcota bacterium]|nr:amidohydrolase [Myxococcota bacterium]MBU1409904.1 amidohydrolase [Myxococcota bacterium]MBU1510835.1 amidohydrolase [Myxococcota bacterium]
MKTLVVACLSMFLCSLACETPPDPYARPVRREAKAEPEPVVEEAPFVPPLETAPAEDNEGLPEYMRPRDSRFSKKMWKQIESAGDEFIALRRNLHMVPELSHREVNTSRSLAQQLEPLGYKLVGPVGLTGFAAVLEGGPGPTVGVVVGMDGAPVGETTRLPYASRAEGYWDGRKVSVSHAHGHDVEMAVAVGTAKLLVSMKENVPGRVVFIFQPGSTRLQAGEGPGAQDVLASGVLSRLGVEVLFQLPVDPGLPVGRVGVPTGAVSGGLTRFKIVIQGTQNRICSGTVPWKCVDPIAVAAHLVQELLLLPSRHFGPNRQVVLNIGRIEGGDAGHTVAAGATVMGTFRWLVPTDMNRMQQLISRVADGAAKIAGTSVNTSFEKGPQHQVGNTAVLMWALPTLVRSLGRRGVMPGDPLAEPGDFSMYQKHMATAMLLLGCGRSSRDGGRRGEGSFSPDEETVVVGVHVLSNLIMDYLHDTGRPKFAPPKNEAAPATDGPPARSPGNTLPPGVTPPAGNTELK